LSTHCVYMRPLQFLVNNCARGHVGSSYHTEQNNAACSTTFQVRDNVLLYGASCACSVEAEKIIRLNINVHVPVRFLECITSNQSHATDDVRGISNRNHVGVCQFVASSINGSSPVIFRTLFTIFCKIRL
jgi:hypothetical protein